MARKMQAAVVEQFGKPLVLRELDIPSPGAGQILVKTEACGVCHTDLHAMHGDWPVKPTLPFIPGHEAIGLVAAVGAGVTIVKEGDRVGVPWLYSACGHCEYCLTAWETVCPEAQFGGYTKNGGFAEYLLGDPNYVAHVPAGLAAMDAAPIICAGITTYKGIKETEAKAWRMDRHLRRRRPRASGDPICQGHGAPGLRGRHRRRQARPRQAPWRRSRDQRQGRRPGGRREEGDRRRSPRRPDYGALAQRVQAGRWHDPQARHLRPGRAAAGRISRPALRCGGELHHHPWLVRRHAWRIWPKRSPSRPRARSRPISSCSLYRRSTTSSTGSSTATWLRAWSSNSRRVEAKSGQCRSRPGASFGAATTTIIAISRPMPPQ